MEVEVVNGELSSSDSISLTMKWLQVLGLGLGPVSIRKVCVG